MGSLREDFLDGLREGMRNESEKLITALADEVDTRGITNRGNLRQNFEKTVISSGANITVQITGVSYANYVAEGTGGYSAPPPISPIKRWVESKLSVPSPLVEDTAYKIRNEIFKHGTPTPGSPMRGRNDYVKGALRRRLPDLTKTLERRAAAKADG